ncbi:MAG: site-2 protease family protein [Thermoplasmata archaeon]
MLAAWVEWTIVAVALIAFYAVVVVVLYRSGRIGPDRSLSLLGPLLMTKTKRGLGLLERLGRFKRFWSVVGDLGIVLAGAAMALIVVVLAVEAVLAFGLGAARAPTPTEALGLPGINPFIPLGYGLVAIVIGIVLHEMFHGIVARSQNIGVKSVGILWLVVPVGAFVEQDDTQMQSASRRSRDRVGAAGILANFLIALVTFLLLILLITTSVHPAVSGVELAGIEVGTPAANLSLQAGDLITQINGTATPNIATLQNVLDASHPGQSVTLTWWNPYQSRYSSGTALLSNSPYDKTRGFLGVAIQPTYLQPAGLLSTMTTPWNSAAGPLLGFVEWLSLPFALASPIQGTSATYFHVTGPLVGLGTGNVLILVNLLYWITWMSLLLGLSNALPLIPLDGNLLFRDWVSGIAARIRTGWTTAQLDNFSGQMTVLASLIIVFLLLWQFVAPRL